MELELVKNEMEWFLLDLSLKVIKSPMTLKKNCAVDLLFERDGK